MTTARAAFLHSVLKRLKPTNSCPICRLPDWTGDTLGPRLVLADRDQQAPAQTWISGLHVHPLTCPRCGYTALFDPQVLANSEDPWTR
jgi:hypothetical protein